VDLIAPFSPEAAVARIDGALTGIASRRLRAGTDSEALAWPGAVIVAELRIGAAATARHQPAELVSLYQVWTAELLEALHDRRVRHLGASGDRVTAVYAAPAGSDIAAVFDLAARANTLRWVVNRALRRRRREPIDAGIGVDAGPVLTISTYQDQDPAVETTVHVGEPITRAEDLARIAGQGDPEPVWCGVGFVDRLDPHRRRLLAVAVDLGPEADAYSGHPVDDELCSWVEARSIRRAG
jgi:class 3 adenylate cyclase